MPCYYPLRAFQTYQADPHTGKTSVQFRRHRNAPDREIDLPCGKCYGCRLERSRQWAVRCMHEASMHEDNCFLTLTYDDAHLPRGGTLVKTHFPAFMKRLRSHVKRECDPSPPPKIKYFHAGEYGPETCRPHYHALLFNIDFGDKVLKTYRGSHPVYTSELLDRLWSHGNCEIGSVTFDSAGYVARYILEKVTGPIAEKWYDGLEPEYATMSRRPSIGAEWYAKYGKEVYPDDRVIVKNKPQLPPRAYDRLLQDAEPDVYERIKKRRERSKNPEDSTADRLMVREECAKARLKLFSNQRSEP